MTEGKRRWMSQLKKRENSPFLCLFVLFGSSVDWLMPTCIGEGHLLYSVDRFQMLITSGNTLTDMPRNNILPAIWTSLSPAKLTHF